MRASATRYAELAGKVLAEEPSWSPSPPEPSDRANAIAAVERAIRQRGRVRPAKAEDDFH